MTFTRILAAMALLLPSMACNDFRSKNYTFGAEVPKPPPTPLAGAWQNGIANNDSWIKVMDCGSGSCVLVDPDDPSRVFAWGKNGADQLGDPDFTGNNTDNDPPVQMDLPSADLTFRMVAVGDNTVYLMTTDGALYAVGNDGSGEAAQPTTSTNLDTMTPMYGNEDGTGPGVSGYIHMAAGSDYFIAVNSSYHVHTVGSADNFQLGDGQKTTDAQYLKPVIGMGGVTPNGGEGCEPGTFDTATCEFPTECEDLYKALAVAANEGSGGWSSVIERQSNDDLAVRAWGSGIAGAGASSTIGLRGSGNGAKHPGNEIAPYTGDEDGLVEKWVTGSTYDLLKDVVQHDLADHVQYYIVDTDTTKDGVGVPYSSGPEASCRRGSGLPCGSADSVMAIPMKVWDPVGEDCDDDFPATAVMVLGSDQAAAVLDENGDVFTTGRNDVGKTGQGTTSGKTNCLTKVSDMDSLDIKIIAFGEDRLCALEETVTGYKAHCTGACGAGECGDTATGSNTGGDWVEVNDGDEVADW